ncbi:galactose-3-O-sulfotransferase 2-like [Ptychodera flava]|uniref:galactose-3-O-sulfotransferase 2-like n=1 Tax=Ptychodera flava TaxID=63121 RepID=UPI00396A7970
MVKALRAVFMVVLPSIFVVFAVVVWPWDLEAPWKRFAMFNPGGYSFLDNGDTRGNCTERQNIVFIKTHKVGGTTLATILYRYGYQRDLSFVINRRKDWNGHLRTLSIDKENPGKTLLPPRDREKRRRFKYNICNIHALYDRPVMDSVMENDTFFVILLRDPVSQFESAFDFFHMDQEIKPLKGKSDPLAFFFTNPNFFMAQASKVRRRDLRNNQFYHLRLSWRFYEDDNFIKTTIKRLDAELDLVMILEYFDESLILLKKKMCWTYLDILYVKKNQRIKKTKVTNEVAEEIRKWNKADTMLYDHFKRKLFSEIEQYGPSFYDDLNRFREMQRSVTRQCVNSRKVVSNNGKTFEYGSRRRDDDICQVLTRDTQTWFQKIWQSQLGLPIRPRWI